MLTEKIKEYCYYISRIWKPC